jgi:hypothetical protein
LSPSFEVATITEILAIFFANQFFFGTSCAGSSTPDLHELPSGHHRQRFYLIFLMLQHILAIIGIL